MKYLIALIFILVVQISQSQTQIGSTIFGENNLDEFGTSISMSANGSRVAVGAPLNSSSAGSDAGHVRVYEKINGNWVQIGTDIDGEQSSDLSGSALAMSADGNTVVIGAPYNDGAANAAGHVRVYSYNGSTWVQRGNDIDGDYALDRSGSAVAINGNGSILAVAAPYNDSLQFDAGQVKVYQWQNNTWNLSGSFYGNVQGGEFGNSISMDSSGNLLCVQMPFNVNGGYASGQIQCYQKNGSNWSNYGSVVYGDTIADRAGDGLNLSNNGLYLAVGAPLNDKAGQNAGRVRVYEFVSGLWTLKGQAMDGEAAHDEFGNALAINNSGTLLSVAAYKNDGFSSDEGEVRAFTYLNASWQPIGNSISGIGLGDQWGSSLAMDTAGTFLAAGAPFSGAGYFRTYQLPGITSISNGQELNDKLFIYPNPVVSFLNIQGIEETKLNCEYQLYSLTGKLIYSGIINSNKIDLHSLAKGSYFLKIFNGNKINSFRVIKQ